MAQAVSPASEHSNDRSSSRRPAGRSLDDHHLISLIASGDVEAFRTLFRRHAPQALSIARAVTRRPDLAEEIVQETFAAVWRDLAPYRRELGTVRAWLMRAVHHRSVDRIRREESERRRVSEASVRSSDEPRAEHHADRLVDQIGPDQRPEDLHRRLGTLPPEQSQVIELMYFQGLTLVQISDVLSIPLGTVKSRTLLGMQRLRQAE